MFYAPRLETCMFLTVLLLISSSSAQEAMLGFHAVEDGKVKGPLMGRELSLGYRQRLLPSFSLEGSGTWLPDLPDRIDTLVYVLVDPDFAPHFFVPLTMDLWRLELIADLAPERDPARLQAVPRLRMGGAIEGRRDYRVYDSTTHSIERRSYVGVPMITEATVELWTAYGWGLGFGVGALVDIRPEPQYDPDEPVNRKEIYMRARAGMDLLVHLGGRR